MLHRSIKMCACATVILFAASFGAAQTFGQGAKPPDVTKAVHWSDAATGTEIYLAEAGGQGYRLTVVSQREVKVTYRTSINSVEPVVKELAPVETVGSVVRYYQFNHYFSKMTIWMALLFEVDGKSVPSLTRAFYNDIYTLVPSNMFLNGMKK